MSFSLHCEEFGLSMEENDQDHMEQHAVHSFDKDIEDADDTDDIDEGYESERVGDFSVSDEEDLLVQDDDSDECDSARPETIGTARDYADEYRAFQSIDRNEEDKLVCQYHKGKSSSVLLRLLNIREQTLRYMAKKYAYLDNEDDMYAEFKGVWLKCVKKYDGRVKIRQAVDRSGNLVVEDDGKPKMVARKTPFNTYLYTSMKNRVRNLLKRRHSKKLLDDNGNPVADTMRSLDYQYGDDGDLTLKDVLADDRSTKASSRAEMSDIMTHLGADDIDIARAVDTFINNPRFDTLTAACNYKVSSLRINKWDREVLALGMSQNGVDPSLENVQKAMSYLKQMVDSTGTYDGKYEIVSFVLYPSRVDFVVHVDDPKVLRKVKDAVMRCRLSMSGHHAAALEMCV